MLGENIARRLRAFAVTVVKLCRALRGDASARHIGRQLVRAATSVGANYEEARGAESRADFIHKAAVANKELREAMYWLQVTRDAELVPVVGLDALLAEGHELVAILTASISTARRRLAASSVQ